MIRLDAIQYLQISKKKFRQTEFSECEDMEVGEKLDEGRRLVATVRGSGPGEDGGLHHGLELVEELRLEQECLSRVVILH